MNRNKKKRTLAFSLIAGIVLCCWRLSLAASGPERDAVFGVHGRVAVELGKKNRGHAVLVQPDGKIVLAGSSSGANGGAMNVALLRLNRNGSLDTGFNHDGTVVTSLVPGDDEALAVGRLSDGRLVAGGYSFNGTDRDFALACYHGNGILDTAFGVDGATLTSIGNGHEEITALVVDPSDRIVVAGTSEGTTGKILVAARYLPNGTLDRRFGEQGICLIGRGRDANAEGVMLRKDGSLILSGSYLEHNGPMAMLIGLHPDGTVDTGFGQQGVATVAGTCAASEGFKVVEDRDGLLYLAGSVGSVGQRDAALFRFTENGSPDHGFGGNGTMLVRQDPADEVLYDIAMASGSVVAAGLTTQGGRRRMLMHTSLGMAATAFGPGEVVGYALAVDATGRVVVVGTAEERAASSMVAVRFVAVDLIDQALDSPGHRSRHIITLPGSKITQTTVTTGGRISGSFAKEIVRRGVLFSRTPVQGFHDAPLDASGVRLMEEGITENGAGTGMFQVELTNVQPASVYHIRAYALTSAGEVYYGDQVVIRTADACFIATAAYGTLLHPCVRILRTFRDTSLQSPPGQRLIRFYYMVSPPLAAAIADNQALGGLMRVALLPVVGFSWLALHIGLTGAVLTFIVIAAIVGGKIIRTRRHD